jgi:YgiT-type zinc finger domain-containing protein
MMKTIDCPMCEESREARPETVREEYDVKGEKIVLDVPRLFCTECGESVIDEAFGDPTLHLYAEYRRRHNLRLEKR